MPTNFRINFKPVLWVAGVFLLLAVHSVAAAEVAEPATLEYQLSANAVDRTNGLTDINEAMREVSHWSYGIYTTTNLALLTNAVWSANFWLKGVQGLSATCIGYSNGLGGQGLITMVSPRHYLCATHMHPEGQVAAFLDTNNVFHWRRTLQRVDVGNDTTVGILNADLPPSVGFLPMLPADYTNYLPVAGSEPVQGIGMNQGLQLFGEPMVFAPGPMVFWDDRRTALSGLTTNWNMALRGGDSSNPAMLLISNQLVLVSHNYFANGGPNYADQIDAINRKMHYLSTNNGVASDYQLTTIVLTNWPEIGTAGQTSGKNLDSGQ
ncbi:MAG TPA: hypothetical protein VMV89_09540 [Candidatus Paceibacterota bacterium]|nr:hypothetical protein [Candidatus Paceibacterota bacterium]